MHKNNIGAEGAQQIADALRETSSLQTLMCVQPYECGSVTRDCV